MAAEEPGPARQDGDHFVYERRLAESAAGPVYLARDRLHGNALRVVKEYRRLPGADVLRLWRESMRQARLSHPALARIDGAVEKAPDGAHRVAREHVDGQSLAEHLARHGVAALPALAAEVLRALDFLHGVGRSHGRLIPSNLLVRDAPRAGYRVVLLDGGALSPPATSPAAATLPYLAPEVLDGAAPAPQADIWALGVSIFTALHGRPPFHVPGGQVEAYREVVRSGRRTRPAAPTPLPRGFTAWLDALIETDMARRPDARTALANLDAIAGPGLTQETATGRAGRLASPPPPARAAEIDALWEHLSPSPEPRLVWLRGPADERARVARAVIADAAARGWDVAEAAADAEAIDRFLAAPDPGSAGPRLLALDGVEAAGPDVADRLWTALRKNTDTPLRILAGIDTGDLGDPALETLVARAGVGPSLRRVDLLPLAATTVAAAAWRCGAAGVFPADELLRMTGGDPTRVDASLIAGARSARSAGDAFAAAAGALGAELSPAALAWCRALAAIGVETPFERARIVSSLGPAEADAAAAEASVAGIAHEGPRGWRLNRPGVPRAWLDRESREARRELGERALATAESAVERAAARVAGGNTAAAIEELCTAARDAMNGGRPAHAAALLARAASFADRDDSRHAQIVEAQRHAIAAARPAHGAAAGLLEQAAAARRAGDPRRAAALYGEARAEAASGGDPASEVRCGAALAQALALAGHMAEADSVGLEIESLALRLGDTASAAIARAARVVARIRCGREAEAIEIAGDLPASGAACDLLVDALIEARLAAVRTDGAAFDAAPSETIVPAAWALDPAALPDPAAIAAPSAAGDVDSDTRDRRTTLELERIAAAGDASFEARWGSFGVDEVAGRAPHLAARATLAAARVAAHAGRRDEALARASDALRRAEACDQPALGAEAAAIAAGALRAMHRGAEARAQAEAGRRLRDVAADRIGEPGLRAAFLERPAFAALAGGAADARRRLTTLYDMSRALNSESDPDALLESILDMALDVVSAERGMILLRDAAGDYSVRLARNLERQTIADAAEFSRNVVLQAGAGRPVLAVDTGNDDRLSSFRSVSAFGIRSVLCVPLRSRGNVVGAVYLDSRAEGALFSGHDLEFLEAFADHAALALENARIRRRLEQENERLQAVAEARAHFGNIVGESPAIREVFALIESFAASDLPVLIQGESGTGKELVARAIHYNGPRRKRIFVSENCAAIPETLLHSALFGHVRGAFTGADRDRPGLFEQADGGTLFLDEVGDMSAGMQAQLLRVLQEGDVRRVGGDRPIHVDVRVLAATHRDLAAETEAGRFRRDLLYRLQVLTVALPPLRERGDDVAVMASHFLARIARERGRPAPVLDTGLLERLRAYHWPGNVRQLENVLQRLSLLAGDGPLTADLVQEDRSLARTLRSASTPSAHEGSLAESEVERIRAALVAAGGNRGQAARLLGISRATIYRKIAEHQIG